MPCIQADWPMINPFITTSISSWFHLAECPAAHVPVQTPGASFIKAVQRTSSKCDHRNCLYGQNKCYLSLTVCTALITGDKSHRFYTCLLINIDLHTQNSKYSNMLVVNKRRKHKEPQQKLYWHNSPFMQVSLFIVICVVLHLHYLHNH